ncbi:hypothetical protein OESDEN_18099 [Oesophagostomum dentatum]|uniref:Uncharacterized protein n=1 Tax=Oesophagostomum dentatum TaxID=61180 RepID=A0A0B1SBC4_OESDE|nr:hypothetical protein OESDEN_18099 [Oesophagostomum dentatum]
MVLWGCTDKLNFLERSQFFNHFTTWPPSVTFATTPFICDLPQFTYSNDIQKIRF